MRLAAQSEPVSAGYAHQRRAQDPPFVFVTRTQRLDDMAAGHGFVGRAGNRLMAGGVKCTVKGDRCDTLFVKQIVEFFLDLAETFDWFAPSVRDVRMLRIESNNDLMPAVERARSRKGA